jgi:predicted  nucleic acid-binding Zn-ribbon protein
MSVTASALREIHRIHRQITDLRGRLDRGPRHVKATDAHLQNLQQKCRVMKESLTRTRMSADDKQLQLQQREDRIDDLKKKLNSCGSNREYQALREQIAADEQANSVLADEILEALESIDQQEAALAREEEERDAVASELERLKPTVEEEQTRLASELERVTHNLRLVEQSLPAEIKEDYERISRVRGEETLAQVDGEICTGCFHKISPQTLNVLMMGNAQMCSSCGALLYLPESEER